MSYAEQVVEEIDSTIENCKIIISTIVSMCERVGADIKDMRIVMDWNQFRNPNFYKIDEIVGHLRWKRLLFT